MCFNAEKDIYQKAIHEAGFDMNLDFNRKYENNIIKGQQKNIRKFTVTNNSTENISSKRKRSILWYNPPFNIYCATKVGREFRNIIEKQLFNKNKLNLSYSCGANLKSKIASHNRKILAGKRKTLFAIVVIKKAALCKENVLRTMLSMKPRLSL